MVTNNQCCPEEECGKVGQLSTRALVVQVCAVFGVLVSWS